MYYRREYTHAAERHSPSAVRTVASLSQAAQNNRTIAERQIVEGARHLLKARHKMAALLPKGLLRDSAWDMILELFVAQEEGGILYVKQLMLSSGESAAAAIRRIDRLEEAGLIERFSDPLDRRRVIVRLQEKGHEAVLTMLKQVFQ
ncbi:MarR family transcriptional regulator [Sphingopyxis sp. MWB1]|uniref:MarR family transcriptional regulator n=1 Tax=Sphingopyxis sp. MWB1 TaxID=1537715 RepID=UPI00068B76B2|nr:MarR family transcriptional regulator [Sphingopyxis sp. MWB1]